MQMNCYIIIKKRKIDEFRGLERPYLQMLFDHTLEYEGIELQMPCNFPKIKCKIIYLTALKMTEQIRIPKNSITRDRTMKLKD